MKLRYVGDAPFFSALSEQEQERVSQRMHLEHRRAGETLFSKGNDSTALYLVKSGWVRLVSDAGAVLANQGPGSLVGETDLFLAHPRSVGAILTSDAELWVLGKEDLLDLIAQAPQIGLKLTLSFGSRLALFDHYLVEHRLKTLSFLSDLGQEALAAIARRLVLLEKKRGEVIVEGGQPPEALFIVESGQVHLESSEEGGDFSELGPGETFGELAVLTGKAHIRSAQAASEVVLWSLPTVEFEALAREYPTVRLALSRTIREPLLPQDQSRAVERLAAMHLFSDLPEDVLWAVAERLLLRHVPAGELVFAQGAPGDAFYLIDSGQVEILSDGRQGSTVLARLGSDEFFGEMALLTGRPRSTAARTATHTNLWVLYRADFEDLVNRYPSVSLALSKVLSERLADMDRRFTESHLRSLKLLATLSPSQLEDVSRRLKPVRYRQGETILREGDPGREMFFMESGRVRVVRGRGRGALFLAELGPGDLFGEMALLTGSPRSATVTALSDVDLWSISQPDFDDLVTAYPNLALALSRLLSERLRHTDERFLRQPAQPVAPPPHREPAPRRRAGAQPESRRPARPRPSPEPSRATQAAPKPDRSKRPTLVTQPSEVATQATVMARRPTLVTQPSAVATQSTVIARRPARPAPKARPAQRRPRKSVASELGKVFGGAVTWFGALSTGAKVRLVVVTMLLAWLVFIAAPALVISTLVADNVTNLQGAIAFVQEVTPPPTEEPLPSATPVPPAAIVEAPAETTLGADVEGAIERAVESAVEAPAKAPPAGAPAELLADPPPEVVAAPVGDAPQAAEPSAEPATPTPWIIVITNTPPPVTDTPVPPTATPVPPTATAQPKAAAAAPTAVPTTPPRTQPPRDLDPRLAALNVFVEPVGVRSGQSYWRLVEVRWQNEAEAGGGHSIYVNVLDEAGGRLVGQSVEVRWQGGSLMVTTEDKPPNEYTANFPMYNCLGSYAVSVPGLPSDTAVGLGLGTADQPNFKVHTNFFLTFQRVTY